MFPRQILYETYDLIDSYGYEQIGGAALGTLGDFLTLGAKQLDDITANSKSVLKNLINTPTSSMYREILKSGMDNADKLKIIKHIDDKLDDPMIIKLLENNFKGASKLSPEILARFDSRILNKMDPDILKDIDPKRLAAKLDPKKLDEVKAKLPAEKVKEIEDALKNFDSLKVFRDDTNTSTLLKNLDISPATVQKIAPPNTQPFKTIDEMVVGLDDPGFRKTFNTADSSLLSTFDARVLNKLEIDALVKVKNFDELAKLDQFKINLLKDRLGPLDKIKLNKAISNKSKQKVFESLPDDVAKRSPVPATKEGNLNVAKADQASWVSRNKGKTFIIGGAAVGVIAYGGYVIDSYIKKQDATFNIIGMEFDKTDTETSIWFIYEVTEENKFELTNNNWILLKENDAVPQIKNETIYKIAEVDNDKRKIRILLDKNELPKTLGSKGKFLYQTTFGVQVTEAVDDVADALGGAATAAVTGVASGVLGKIAETFGMSTKSLMIGAGAIIGLIFILIIIYIVMQSKNQ